LAAIAQRLDHVLAACCGQSIDSSSVECGGPGKLEDGMWMKVAGREGAERMKPEVQENDGPTPAPR